MFIKELHAKKIEDSRGEDTIEVSANWCTASSPSGKSTGKHETPPYRKNIDWNIKSINSLNIGFPINSFDDLKKVENLICSEFALKDAKHFGANALFALESAILKALAKEQKKELWQVINPRARKLPVPVGNAVGGGLHSHEKNHPVFQEFLIIPMGKSARENVEIMKSAHSRLKKILHSKKCNDEGAWETSLDEEEIIKILSEFDKIRAGLDIASSSFYEKNSYHYNDKTLSREEQIDYINELIEKYKLFYVEDPLDEEDFRGFAKIKHSPKNLIVGDDLTVTHLDKIKTAIKNNSINAMIVKPNQNGSLLDLKLIFDFLKEHKIKSVFSHRSGETLDDAIADYAFGFQADFIKCGIATKWRDAKLRRLIKIESQI